MKKIIKFLCLILVAFSTLTGCGKYNKQAGLYEAIVVRMNGIDITKQYEYYTIDLKANGECIMKSKGVDSPTSYEAEATFEIEDETIKIYTEVSGGKVTEEYD